MQCSIDDVAELWSNSTRRARKVHKCYECGHTIPIGAPYNYTTAMWGGMWHKYHTCERCWDLWENFMALGYCVLHGGLMDGYQGYLDGIYSERSASEILAEAPYEISPNVL